MIIRSAGGTTYLTPQPDHAWASGDLARYVRQDFFVEGFEEDILAAVRHHDDGWIEWEENPERHPDGRPLNFVEVGKQAHTTMWRKGIEQVHDSTGPFAAAMLTLHAEALFREDLDQEFALLLARRRLEWVREALPEEDPVVRQWKLERAYYVLRLCDLLTLLPLAGWTDPTPTTLIGVDGRHHELTLHLHGQWGVRVDGWPFTLNRVTTQVPLIEVRDGEWDRALADLRGGRRSSVEIVVEPG